jgi:hypothetical protein
MSTDKLLLTKSTTLEQVAHYFKDLGPDKQVRARELGGVEESNSMFAKTHLSNFLPIS